MLYRWRVVSTAWEVATRSVLAARDSHHDDHRNDNEDDDERHLDPDGSRWRLGACTHISLLRFEASKFMRQSVCVKYKLYP